MSVLRTVGVTLGAIAVCAGLGWLFVMWLFGPNDVNKL